MKVEVREDKGDKFGSAEEWTRNQVISTINRGKSFVTILRRSDNKWKRGQDVHTITVNDVKYIRTDRNHKSSDNLGKLPEF